MSKEEHSKEPKPKKVKKINNKSKHKDYHDKSHIPYSLNLITPIINDLLLSESISSITQVNNSLTIIQRVINNLINPDIYCYSLFIVKHIFYFSIILFVACFFTKDSIAFTEYSPEYFTGLLFFPAEYIIKVG